MLQREFYSCYAMENKQHLILQYYINSFQPDEGNEFVHKYICRPIKPQLFSKVCLTYPKSPDLSDYVHIATPSFVIDDGEARAGHRQHRNGHGRSRLSGEAHGCPHTQ